MKVDAIRLELRPRSMFEAADLGVRMVSAHRRAVWASCAPAYAAVLAIAAAIAAVFGLGWASFAVFWLKPWFDRPILFVLARAAFGEETRFADVWTERRAVFARGLLNALTIRRLSLWRSYVQPVLQLEGQRGKARRQRVAGILGAHRGAALAMQGAFSAAETSVLLGAIALVQWLAPGDTRGVWLDTLGGHTPLQSALFWFACYATAVLVVEPFFVGAGFAMYLNRRVELEAWDIEQEFRLAFAG